MYCIFESLNYVHRNRIVEAGGFHNEKCKEMRLEKLMLTKQHESELWAKLFSQRRTQRPDSCIGHWAGKHLENSDRGNTGQKKVFGGNAYFLYLLLKRKLRLQKEIFTIFFVKTSSDTWGGTDREHSILIILN